MYIYKLYSMKYTSNIQLSSLLSAMPDFSTESGKNDPPNVEKMPFFLPAFTNPCDRPINRVEKHVESWISLPQANSGTGALHMEAGTGDGNTGGVFSHFGIIIRAA